MQHTFPRTLTLGVLVLLTTGLYAQKQRPTQHSTTPPTPEQLRLRPEALRSVPLAPNPFGVTAPQLQPLPALTAAPSAPATVRVTRDPLTRQPIWWQGQTEVSKTHLDQPLDQRALAYLASLKPEGVTNPATAFSVLKTETDEQGNSHVRIGQTWNGLPVYGAELVAHADRNGTFERANGRYFPTPNLNSATPTLSAEQAIAVVKSQLGTVKTEWSATDLKLIGDEQPFEATLVVYHVGNQINTSHLAYHIVAHPNVLRRVVFFVNANDGAVLNQYEHTCEFGIRNEQNAECDAVHSDSEIPHSEFRIPNLADGPVTASGVDLLGTNRTFGAWQAGSKYYLEDASQPMFNSGASQMPGEPVGAIVTVDALNTSPANDNSFNYDLAFSNSLTVNNTTAVSTHWNSIQSYLYYKNKFNRNSIDGEGGNVIAFFNVADDDGSSMENAFWNGAAMWYGNGGSTFRRLARGLDVGGHEMTHGVIEKTANLEYQDESGALNESFADVFGAMIDLGDWQIGEDVMQPGTHTCLRDLSNPHNGVNSNSPFWQPNHVNEQYNGNEDNGGVHINSGITNRAYYLFATNAAVGTAKAEQVYYKALRDYLVKSSKFVDCRIAVIQAATDLYGSAVANAAASAFDQVGITGSAPSGNYLGELLVNPGTSYVLCVADDYSSLDLADGNGNVLGTVYDEQNIKSRPSVSDNGGQAVFVNEEGHIIGIDFQYNGNQIIPTLTQISSTAEWRNAAISKDGRFLAAVTDFQDNNIYVYDLLDVNFASETFALYNPTYTQGQITGDVEFADVLEFDYSGEYLMYDSYNALQNTQGEDIGYWDIGFVRFFANGQYTNGADAPISKLFSGLPEQTNVGNPTFAKRSPFIIAFDLYNGLEDQNDVLGANTETGDYGVIASNVGDYSWPNYTRTDNGIIFHSPGIFSTSIYFQGVNASKIQPQGSESEFISDHVQGVWYANGNRSLSVDTHNPTAAAPALAVTPNPTHDVVQLAVKMPAATTARLEVVDLLGQTLQSHTVSLAAGDNFADLSLGNLPSGTYVVRLTAGGTTSVAKVVRQ